MGIEEKITELKPYFRGIEMYNDAIMVKVAFPSKWRVYGSDDGRINTTPSDNEPNVIFYYGDSNNTNYEEIFSLIKQTIKANEEIGKKLELLKVKVEELKELFSSNSYDELKGLKFVLEPEKKEKAKRKYQRKKKVEENENNEQIVVVEKEAE